MSQSQRDTVGFPFFLRHVNGCGEIAFYLTEKLSPNDKTSSRTARHLDGTPMTPHDVMRCDSCGKPLEQEDVQTRYVESSWSI